MAVYGTAPRYLYNRNSGRAAQDQRTNKPWLTILLCVRGEYLYEGDCREPAKAFVEQTPQARTKRKGFALRSNNYSQCRYYEEESGDAGNPGEFAGGGVRSSANETVPAGGGGAGRCGPRGRCFRTAAACIHQPSTLRIINGANLASASDPINGITANTVANARLRVPYLGFSPTGLQYADTVGACKYNSLQINIAEAAIRGPHIPGSLYIQPRVHRPGIHHHHSSRPGRRIWAMGTT